jgi:hypothetical protein
MENISEAPVLKPIETPAQPEQQATSVPTQLEQSTNPTPVVLDKPEEKRIGLLRKILNSFKGQGKQTTTPSLETPPQEQPEKIKMSPAMERFANGEGIPTIQGGVPISPDNTPQTQQ